MRSSIIQSAFIAVIFGIFLFMSCNPTAETFMRMPLHTVEVLVVDENDEPIPGAIIESTDGQRTTADTEGMASLRFGSLGIHMLTVLADDRAPSTMSITLPADRGRTVTARLGQPVEFTAPILVGGLDFWGMAVGQLYPMLFSYMFSAYGYNIDLDEYQPGQWTEWRILDTFDEPDEVLVMRKAFLQQLDNGQEWWQISFTDEELEDAYVIEILFDEERSSIRRIREKLGDGVAQERPVTEGWYYPPMKMTEESLEGAVALSGEQVELPAGVFSADVLRFGVAPGMALQMWRVLEVPGGVVRYETIYEEDEEEFVYSSQLVDFGDGAITLLESY